MKKRVVQAGGFEVVDDEGRVRARIGMSSDDSPFLSFHDAEGRVRARFGLSADGAAGLAIGDEDGKVRATLGLAADGSASMALGDKRGKIRAKFGLAAEGAPTFGLAHKELKLARGVPDPAEVQQCSDSKHVGYVDVKALSNRDVAKRADSGGQTFVRDLESTAQECSHTRRHSDVTVEVRRRAPRCDCETLVSKSLAEYPRWLAGE